MMEKLSHKAGEDARMAGADSIDFLNQNGDIYPDWKARECSYWLLMANSCLSNTIIDMEFKRNAFKD